MKRYRKADAKKIITIQFLNRLNDLIAFNFNFDFARPNEFNSYVHIFVPTAYGRKSIFIRIVAFIFLANSLALGSSLIISLR